MKQLPSCPACGTANDRTEDRELAPIQRTPKADGLVRRFPYTCGRCSTLFAGTDLEWRAMRRQREEWATTQAKLAAEKPDPEPASQ